MFKRVWKLGVRCEVLGGEDGRKRRREDGRTVVNFKFQDLGVTVGNVHYPITFTLVHPN